MNGSGVQMTPRIQLDDSVQIPQEAARGGCVATVAPEVLARACEEASIPRGTVFSFGRPGWKLNPAWGNAPYEIDFLVAPGSERLAEGGLYRGIEFGADPYPIRMDKDGYVISRPGVRRSRTE